MILKIKIPDESEVYVRKGDSARDLLVYEAEVLKVLEEVKLEENNKYHFFKKDGQYVKKGDKLFTTGFITQRTFMADCNGILEITDAYCRILGKKEVVKKRVNFLGKVQKIIPDKYVFLKLNIRKLKTCFFVNNNVASTKVMMNQSSVQETPRKALGEDNNPSMEKSTLFMNKNISVSDLAKYSALGYRRVLVDSLNVDNIHVFHKELHKFDSFGVVTGFGYIKEPGALFENSLEYDIVWGKDAVWICDKYRQNIPRISEHPFWGGRVKIKDIGDIVTDVQYNKEEFKIYNKNF